MAEHKIKMSWADIDEVLTKAGIIPPSEKIKEITLVKPKEMLIHLKEKK